MHVSRPVANHHQIAMMSMEIVLGAFLLLTYSMPGNALTCTQSCENAKTCNPNDPKVCTGPYCMKTTWPG